MIQITVNGETREISDPQTINDLLASFSIEPKMVVVELNGEIIPRASFPETMVNESAALEIVQMMAGG